MSMKPQFQKDVIRNVMAYFSMDPSKRQAITVRQLLERAEGHGMDIRWRDWPKDALAKII